MMAAREVKDYLDNGNIVNSVNLPVLSMPWAAKTRVCVITKNADGAAVTAAVPAVASAFKARGDYGYYILDTDAAVDAAAIAAIPGVLRVRVLSKEERGFTLWRTFIPRPGWLPAPISGVT